MTFLVPEPLAAACRRTPERAAWLERLPDVVAALASRWALAVGPPYTQAGAAWVAPADRADGTPAVLKVGMPHLEGEHEAAGLRVWAGDPTVELLRADDDLGAMLLERCVPGTPLGSLPEPEQDVVIAGLLGRIWLDPPEPHTFRPLSTMTAYWAGEAVAGADRWADPGLVRAGLRLYEELPRSAASQVLLATDVHAGNVLRAERAPWLVIDPKPFVGDPAYDATQHLLNCEARLRSDPLGTIGRFSDLLGVDRDRVRLWTFARLAAGPPTSSDPDRFERPLARALAP